MRRIILPLSLLALACQPAQQQLTEAQKAGITQEIAQDYQALGTAIKQLNQDAVLQFWQQSDDVTFVENATVTHSFSAVTDLIHKSWPVFASVESFQYGDLITQVLDPNVAVVTTTFDFAGTDTTGAAVAFHGIATYVWLNTDNGWKIVNATETSPRPETNQ